MASRSSPLLAFVFGLGVVVALVAAIVIARPNWGQALPMPPFLSGRGTPVLVILLEEKAAVDALRAAIATERVVSGASQGFALYGADGRGRRIVASGYEAVGPLLEEAGWLDAAIEVATPPSLPGPDVDPLQRRRERGRGIHDLALLAAKPTLTQAEALRLLEAIEP